MSGYFKLNNRKGAFLLEALLSVTVLSVSITLIIQSMTASLRAVQYTSRHTIALNLLENKMFGIIRKGFAGQDLKEGGNFPPPNESYQYFLEINPLDAGMVPHDDNEFQGGLKKVNLLASWGSGKKRNSISLETYFLNTNNDNEASK